jgi:hypothetical protein
LWRNQLVWTFARHAISEELTMYPTMVEKLGEEGKKMTETDLEQHQAVCSRSVLTIILEDEY